MTPAVCPLLPALTNALNRHPTATRHILFALTVIAIYAAALGVQTLAALPWRELAPLL